MSTSSPDANAQLVRRLYEECINEGKPERCADLVSEDYVDDVGGKGPAGFVSNINSLLASFPDIRFTLQDLVSQADRVVVRWTWEGTHTGRFRAWAPTGKRVTNSGIAIYKLERGKVVRVWLETDRLGVLQQIGAIPERLAPAPATP